jgi:transcriptional regulator with XRE-family HTH domain
MAETVGEQLKKARLDRGLTLLEASHQTRIRPHYLEALENDRRDLLPSIVQGGAFCVSMPISSGFPQQPWSIFGITNHRMPHHLLRCSQPPGHEPSQDEEADQDDDQDQNPTQPPVPSPPAAEKLSSQLILIEIGRKLRRQRESLNLKISDIERFTHLRQKYIEALEKGDIDELPSPVQGRGMLSNYARFLNMDDEAIAAAFR